MAPSAGKLAKPWQSIGRASPGFVVGPTGVNSKPESDDGVPLQSHLPCSIICGPQLSVGYLGHPLSEKLRSWGHENGDSRIGNRPSSFRFEGGSTASLRRVYSEAFLKLPNHGRVDSQLVFGATDLVVWIGQHGGLHRSHPSGPKEAWWGP